MNKFLLSSPRLNYTQLPSTDEHQAVFGMRQFLFSRLSAMAAALPLCMAVGGFSVAHAAARAFPGAEGFGALVTGGRGGKVVHVTNLNDTGAGSLRDAISAGNRIVVFDVGGVVTIASQLVIAGDNVTIAGQTAPGKGITVYGDGTSVSNRRNVIIRYMRFRQGIDSGDGTKALNVTDGSNMIFDHVSVQWGRWDTIGLTGATTTVTIQYSLMGESIDPQRFGGLVDSADQITLSHNLWLDSQSRSPKFKANGQYINNIVYNWGANGLGGGHSAADWYEDIINNYFIKGPSSTGGFATGYANTDRVFNSGNLADLDLDGKLAGRAVVAADFQGDTPPTFGSAAHNVPPVAVTVETPAAAYASVIAGAGSSLCRDPVDLRLLGHVTSLGTKGAIVVDETLVGGQPAMTPVMRPSGFDTDQDGMPDVWETANGLNPNSASDATSDLNGDGYTNIEKYLNEIGSAPPDSCGAAGTVDAGTGATDAGGTDVGGTGGPDVSAASDGPRDTSSISDAGGSGGEDRAPTVDVAPDAGAGGSDGPRQPASDAGGGQQDAPILESGVGGMNDATSAHDANADAGAVPGGSAGGCGCGVGAGDTRSTSGVTLLAAMASLLIVRARRRRTRA